MFFRKLLVFKSRDSASDMFVCNNIDNFYTRLRKSCGKFMERLLSSTNLVISTTKTPVSPLRSLAAN